MKLRIARCMSLLMPHGSMLPMLLPPGISVSRWARY